MGGAERLAIRPECFQSIDLTGQWSIPGKFDLAICLEVAEHLTESKFNKIRKTLGGSGARDSFFRGDSRTRRHESR